MIEVRGAAPIIAPNITIRIYVSWLSVNLKLGWLTVFEIRFKHHQNSLLRRCKARHCMS